MSLLAKLVSAALLAGVVACTAIVSTDATQCSTTPDCTKRGPDFVNTTCSAGLCVASAAATVSIPHECNTNADCASKGAGMVCSSNFFKCAPTTSADCKVAYGDPTAEGTVLYGLMSEIGRDDTLYFRQEQNLTGAVLAFKQFFETANIQLPGNRKGALIACSEHSPNAASALLANAGVKAVIGPADEQHQTAIVQTLLPAHIPTFSPWINGNPASVIPGSDGYSWLAGFQRSDVIPPLNALLAEREAQLRLHGANSIRVAVIVNTDPTTATAFTEYGTFADQRLLFNGKTAVENQDDPGCGNCYQRFGTNQTDKATVDQRATDIFNFKPDVIIPFTDIDWGAQLLPALEAKFAATLDERPYYLPPFLQIEDAGYKSLNVSAASLRARIQGIRPLRDNSFEVFANEFKAAYPPPSDPTAAGPDPNPGAGHGFETSLLLLLATYAALTDDPNATPDQVVAALPKITDDAAGRVTLTDLVPAIGQLNAKAHINFDGLFTFFDFDATSHSAPAKWTTWCVGPQGQYTSSGRVFASGLFDGTAGDCP